MDDHALLPFRAHIRPYDDPEVHPERPGYVYDREGDSAAVVRALPGFHGIDALVVSEGGKGPLGPEFYVSFTALNLVIARNRMASYAGRIARAMINREGILL